MPAKTLIHTIVVFLMVALPLQAKHRIYGYVYAPDKSPASWASVSVQGTDHGVLTREDGYFDLHFNEGDTIVFSMMGCKVEKVAVPFEKNEFQKFVFLKDESHELHEVEVRALQKQGTSNSRLDLSALENTMGTHASVERLLTTQAGVSNRNELSNQYSVRGGNFDENCVYINGIEVYRPLLVRTGEQEGLSIINSEMTQSVEFSAGGYGAQYTDKTASVLDIQYKDDSGKAGMNGSVSANLLGGDAFLHHTTQKGKFMQMHGLRYKTNNYLFSSLDKQGDYDQRCWDFQSYLIFRPSRNWSFDLLANMTRNAYTNIPESQTTTYGTLAEQHVFKVFFDGKEEDLFQTEMAALRATWKVNKRLALSLTANAYMSDERVNYDIAGEYWIGDASSATSVSQSTELGVGNYRNYARNRLNVKVASVSHNGIWGDNTWRIRWGSQLKHESIDDSEMEFEMRDSAGYSLPYQSSALKAYKNLWSDHSMSSFRLENFIQTENRISSRFGTISTALGVRLSYWNWNDEWIISPRGTIAFFPKALTNWDFRLSTGIYYQSPFYKEVRKLSLDADDNTVVTLNKDIRSQRSLHFVAGTDYFFKVADRPFKLTGELYYKPSNHVETYTVNNLQIIYSGENDAKAYTAGLDMKLYGEFVPGTDSWISLSLMRSREKKNDATEWTSRPNEQRWNVSIFFQDYMPRFPKWKIHLRAVWEDGLPFWAPNSVVHTDKNTIRGKSYRRLDMGVTRVIAKGDFSWIDKSGVWTVLKSINLGAEVMNLLDLRNVASYYWVTDVNGYQHAVPNYLTARQLNFSLRLKF